MTDILVLYDSRHGNVARMARCVARGVERAAGMQACVRTVPPSPRPAKQSMLQFRTPVLPTRRSRISNGVPDWRSEVRPDSET